MGAVYLIQDDHGRSFAAKILLPDEDGSAGDAAIARFVREAELAMTVRHPNLMPVYDVGRDPDTGYCYMIMDFAPGGSLSQRIRENGVLPVSEALRVVRAIAGALQAIEAKHVVHRDIKSENILFTATGVPLLTDLGIAHRARQKTESSSSTLTMDGMMIGTPAYMAPEQAMNARTADIRADIYSLGVVLFEMLTGRLPYAGCTTMEMLARLMRGVPVPDVRTLRESLPEGVATLVRRMCAPQKARRLQNTEQLFALLDRVDDKGDFKRSDLPTAKRKRPNARLIVAVVFAGFLVGGFTGGVFLAKKMVRSGGVLDATPSAPVQIRSAPAPADESDLEDVDELSLVAAKVATQAARVPKSVVATPAPVRTASPSVVRPAPVQKSVVKQPVETVSRPMKPVGQTSESVESVDAEPEPDELWDICRAYADLQREAGAMEKVLAAVNAARVHDPDFKSFDLNGKARDVVLSEEKRSVLARGKIFFVMERLKGEMPDFAQRCVAAEKRLRAAGKLSKPTTQRDIVLILGEAAGKPLDDLFRGIGVR